MCTGAVCVWMGEWWGVGGSWRAKGRQAGVTEQKRERGCENNKSASMCFAAVCCSLAVKAFLFFFFLTSDIAVCA